MFFNVLIFRFIGIFMIIGISQLIMRKTIGLSVKDLIFISYAGMIRGAVAFGLVLRLYADNAGLEDRSVIVTSSYFLVLATIVIMGCTVPSVHRILFGEIDSSENQEIEMHQLIDGDKETVATKFVDWIDSKFVYKQ